MLFEIFCLSGIIISTGSFYILLNNENNKKK